jgi:hypothetical protein
VQPTNAEIMVVEVMTVLVEVRIMLGIRCHRFRPYFSLAGCWRAK